MIKLFSKSAPVTPPQKKTHRIGKFFLMFIGYILIILIFLNGLIDLLEGSFYRRYNHYYTVISEPTSGSILGDIIWNPFDRPVPDADKSPTAEAVIPSIATIPAIEIFKSAYPAIALFGDTLNPYFIGTDGYSCKILDRGDMANRVCSKIIDSYVEEPAPVATPVTPEQPVQNQ